MVIGAIAGLLWFRDKRRAIVGSSTSMVYHRANCDMAAKVSPRNLVRFASPQAAINHGYRPCVLCSQGKSEFGLDRSPAGKRSRTASSDRAKRDDYRDRGRLDDYSGDDDGGDGD